jgi:hypothetical protein
VPFSQLPAVKKAIIFGGHLSSFSALLISMGLWDFDFFFSLNHLLFISHNMYNAKSTTHTLFWRQYMSLPF